MRRSPLAPVVTVVAALAAAVALGAPPASSVPSAATARAGTGTVTGTLTVPPASRRDVFAATAYLARLDRPGAIRPVPVSARGTFRTRTAPGLYSVVTSDYARKAPRSEARVVLVRSGRTVRVREHAVTSRRAGTTRVSVGRFTPPAGADADAKYFAQGMSDLTITDLVQAVVPGGGCTKDVRVYEDRTYGRFKDIIRELRLEASRFASPETRRAARAALRNLPKVAPTLRVMGAVTSLSETSAAGQVRVVDIASGRTVFSKDISSASPLGLSVEAAAAVSRFLCTRAAETVPAALSGTLSGSVGTGSQVLTWTGTVTKGFVGVDPQTGFAYLDSAHYRTTAASITWQLTGRCSGGGTLSLADLSTDFYDTVVDWRATAGKGWGYQLGLSPVAGTQAMLAPCPPDADGHPTPPYNAASLVGAGEGGALMENSDTRGAETNRFSPDKVVFRGSLSINPGYAQTWTWDLTGSGEVPVPSGAG